jgi:hypothetical protein
LREKKRLRESVWRDRRRRLISKKRRLMRLLRRQEQLLKKRLLKRLQPQKNWLNRQTGLSEQPHTNLSQKQSKSVVLVVLQRLLLYQSLHQHHHPEPPLKAATSSFQPNIDSTN